MDYKTAGFYEVPLPPVFSYSLFYKMVLMSLNMEPYFLNGNLDFQRLIK